ncbi:50S ribosomal protein L4 [Halobacteriales archaeon SW_7_68_16]|nr:MAG: 50S ribosomal protein L4 [Halobacteriales archaeon SW_7_68_16]
MQATVYDLNGDAAGEVELPDVFETPYRPDMIARAVRAAQANRKQAYGSDEHAGLRTPAESFGSGRGMAHVPRENGQGRRVPQTVGGRKAHPPKAEADRTEKINDKERRQAVRSAVAATADADRVAERGHAFDRDEVPVVLSDAFEDVHRTAEAVEAFEAVGVYADVERADEGRTTRAGRGTTRGRGSKTPASLLVVTSSEVGPSRAARNLAGATVTTAADADAEDLAPGTHPGRLTVYTESALAEVAER